MFHNLKVPDQCLALWQTCHSLVPDLIKDCPVKTPDLVTTSVSPLDPTVRSVYLIKDGTINETYQGQLIVSHEVGDLVGADGLLQEKSTKYENDFAVTVDEYDGVKLLDSIFKDKEKFLLWNHYLSCLMQSYQLIMCHFSQQGISFKPEYRFYKQGDVIIQEDTESNEVFTLLSGTAKVVVNNTEVGEINKDEIFGAIGALTNTKRIATIIATSDCETIVVKSDSFRNLLTSRPDTVQKLIHDMARTIVSSNDRIMVLKKLVD